MLFNQYRGEKIGFRQRIICNCCNAEFEEEPSSCPVCDFVTETQTKIDNMKNEDEYRSIGISISRDLEDCIPKFDLFNMLNRKAKELGFKN